MPAFTYFYVFNISKGERTIKPFRTMSDAMSYCRSYRCNNTIVFVARYDEILACKSDIVSLDSFIAKRY